MAGGGAARAAARVWMGRSRAWWSGVHACHWLSTCYVPLWLERDAIDVGRTIDGKRSDVPGLAMLVSVDRLLVSCSVAMSGARDCQ